MILSIELLLRRIMFQQKFPSKIFETIVLALSPETRRLLNEDEYHADWWNSLAEVWWKLFHSWWSSNNSACLYITVCSCHHDDWKTLFLNLTLPYNAICLQRYLLKHVWLNSLYFTCLCHAVKHQANNQSLSFSTLNHCWHWSRVTWYAVSKCTK